MHLPTLILNTLLPLTLACNPSLLPRQSNSSTFPYAVPGNDTPADPATAGYFINHFALNVNNLTRSLDFYTQVFGLRHMFSYYITPHLSVTYLGHAQGGRDGMGYQTSSEMLRHKQNSAGLVELIHFNGGGDPIPGGDVRVSTFGHVGIIVPDPNATAQRLREYGATVYKDIGGEWPSEGPIGSPFALGDASGLSEEGWQDIRREMGKLNQLNVFAADPVSRSACAKWF